MTCIVGKVFGDHVVIGGDSYGGDYSHYKIRKDPKVFQVGEFIFGCTSSYRMIQILRFQFTPPRIPNGYDIEKYMVDEFIDVLMKTFKSRGFSRIENNSESGGNFLVGIRNRLFEVFDDFQIAEYANGFASCGSGYLPALGALYMGASLEDTLKAAESIVPTVRSPFIFLSTEKT